jgi:hypothetical protein
MRAGGGDLTHCEVFVGVGFAGIYQALGSPVSRRTGKMVLFSTRRNDPKISPGGARGKSPLAAGNSVPREGSPLSRRLSRVLLGDIQDQRHVVAMR